MIDLLISHGIVITMDPERRVIEDGAVAIQADRIMAVGPTEMVLRSHPQAQRVIEARRKAVLPGFIDSHAHAGHGLVKTLGTDQEGAWYQAIEQIYTEGSTEAFWEAEALLSALERLKCGTTTGVSYLGGGEGIMRTDDPAYGAAYCRAVTQVGNRAFLAVGPGQPPFPRRYAQWTGQDWREVMVSFEQQLATCETLIQEWHGQAEGRLHLCLCFPTYKPDSKALSRAEFQLLRTQAQTTRDLSRQYKLLFTQDGHTQGTIQFAHEQLDLLGPDVFLSHCTNLTAEEIDICRQTDTRIVHNPSAIFSILGRCPVPELLDAGVTVMLGSDGTAPDRSYDMFRHMFQCMHYHRTYYHDPSYLPPGKVLEMVTIDAARGLGLADELGSLEPGKKADLILVDLYKPHTYPLNMPVYRTVYFAHGADVDTVIIDGKILMEQRVVQTVDETRILNMAQRETEAMLERTGLHHLLEIPDGFWGHSKYP